MTTNLHKAFAAAELLPADKQDMLASWILMELAEEDTFDRAIQASAPMLATFMEQALSQHAAGQTEPLDHDHL